MHSLSRPWGQGGPGALQLCPAVALQAAEADGPATLRGL